MEMFGREMQRSGARVFERAIFVSVVCHGVHTCVLHVFGWLTSSIKEKSGLYARLGPRIRNEEEVPLLRLN